MVCAGDLLEPLAAGLGGEQLIHEALHLVEQGGLGARHLTAAVIWRLLMRILRHSPRLNGEWLVGGATCHLLLEDTSRCMHRTPLRFEELQDGGDELLVHLLTLLGGDELLQELLVDHPEFDVLALEHVHLAEDVRLRVDEAVEGPRDLQNLPLHRSHLAGDRLVTGFRLLRVVPSTLTRMLHLILFSRRVADAGGRPRVPG